MRMSPRPVPSIFLSAILLCTGSLSGQGSGIRFGNEIPPEVESIYERGLAYLAGSQSSDGTWRSRSEHGITGLCLMAFLASGEDPNFGRYRQNVKGALRSIIAGQEPSGFIPNSMYHHGFAMLALAEAYGAVDEARLWDGSEPDDTRKSIAETLEGAIELAVDAQNTNRWGGWRYSPTSTDADTSVTGSVLMGLLACRNAGLKVPDEVIENALAYMQRSTASSGFVAYSGGIGGGGESMARSSVATLVYAVGNKRDWPEYEAALAHISERLEHRETAHTHYFAYYMAQALFQGNPEAWERWNRQTARELSDKQADDGSFVGSYGESYGTAMSLLALGLNYRFLPIYERF